ncbi:hypothetical protein AOLI_G00093900 [Acnodon oligacanthus]
MDTRSLIIYVTVMMTVCPVKDGHPDFWPAEIFGRPTVKAGENMQLNCIDFDKRGSNKQLHLYLLKNGAGVIMELLRERHEHIFTVINVSVLDSGNYSCVFSLTKYPLKNLNASALKPGQKTIQVQVIDNSSPITDKHPQQNIQHSEHPLNMSTNENDGQVQLSDLQLQINFIRLFASCGVVIFASLIVVFEVYSTKQRNSVALNSAKTLKLII